MGRASVIRCHVPIRTGAAGAAGKGVRPAALALTLLASLQIHLTALAQAPAAVKVNPLRAAYYGDLHLHTSYSLDAYMRGTKIDPDEAYRFAKGEVLTYLGQSVRRRESLDFLAVTDHSEMIGVYHELEDPGSGFSNSAVGKTLRALFAAITGPDGRHDLTRLRKDPGLADRWETFWRESGDSIFPSSIDKKLPYAREADARNAWNRVIGCANRNYEPGKFTTFVAYEWSSAPHNANLHRNVIFSGNAAPYPFTSFDSTDPQDLWNWLEKIRREGFEALAIPHNANASNGLMYDWLGERMMDRPYAEERQANEPLSEISQTKGASETHPLLSPNDEFADYEIYDFMENWRKQVGRPQGSYLRDALSAGLVLQRRLGTNPFKYGFVGGSDLHSGLSMSAQADHAGDVFVANIGGGKPTQEQAIRRLAPAGDGTDVDLKMTSGNLTGVWAESNTRESIYGALRRRETFATSGTRLKFRFFGGWSFSNRLLQEKDWVATAYSKSVPMGGDLPREPAKGGAPAFAIWAIKDPNGASLDRVQVVKVWEEAGQQKEKVFDVAWAGDRKPDPKTGRLPAIRDTVDLKTGRYTNDSGAAELRSVWTDPEFNSERYAAYYLRVLEIPTPRWSTLLALENGLPLPDAVPATEQQRGWSSPIWYSPPNETRH